MNLLDRLVGYDDSLIYFPDGHFNDIDDPNDPDMVYVWQHNVGYEVLGVFEAYREALIEQDMYAQETGYCGTYITPIPKSEVRL